MPISLDRILSTIRQAVDLLAETSQRGGMADWSRWLLAGRCEKASRVRPTNLALRTGQLLERVNSHSSAIPGPCPSDATAATKELHIAQALDLNTRILHDKTKPDSEQAAALWWVAHLVADSHQPCHAHGNASVLQHDDQERVCEWLGARESGSVEESKTSLNSLR